MSVCPVKKVRWCGFGASWQSEKEETERKRRSLRKSVAERTSRGVLPKKGAHHLVAKAIAAVTRNTAAAGERPQVAKAPVAAAPPRTRRRKLRRRRRKRTGAGAGAKAATSAKRERRIESKQMPPTAVSKVIFVPIKRGRH